MSLKKEYGHVENGFGNFVPVESDTDYSAINDVPVDTTTIGMMHSHFNNFATGNIHPETGDPEIIKPIKIQSPKDVQLFLVLLRNAANNNIPLKKVYLTMVSSSGVYTLKYDGNANNIPAGGSTNGLTAEKFEKKFIEYIKKYKNERGLLKFMKDEMGISNVSLYRTMNNGNTKKYYLEGDKDKLKKDVCHED
ncbi:hypothetical protein BST92_05630 [Nonlabens arenilitoris]|uniref:Uncharacterized protein n=1 Tax=Nonlabens arenilitoris TaxID=1217969 RepID=A0A2S7UAK0_9FLAO|nr:hypothetical protein BST92_05630 [Nonlabens arenilitoris]